MNLEYECHVTVKDGSGHRDEWNEIAKQLGWKTSFIVGDSPLGKAGFFYFTCHHNDVERMFSKMRSLVAVLGVPQSSDPESGPVGKVVREKIELIVYDTKKKLIWDSVFTDPETPEKRAERKALPRHRQPDFHCTCSDTYIHQSWLHAVGCPEYAPQFINGG